MNKKKNNDIRQMKTIDMKELKKKKKSEISCYSFKYKFNHLSKL